MAESCGSCISEIRSLELAYQEVDISPRIRQLSFCSLGRLSNDNYAKTTDA